MERLHANLSKTGRSPMMVLGAALGGSTSLSAKLQEYISKAHMMVEKGPEVAALQVKIKELSLSRESVKSLLPMLQQLPGLQQGLRLGATEVLFSEAHSKLVQLWQWLEQSKKDQGLLTDMSSLLSESTMVFPMDGNLQGYMLKCGEFLKQVGEQDLVHNVIAACEAVDQMGDDLAGCVSALDKLKSEVASLGVGSCQNSEKLAQVFADQPHQHHGVLQQHKA